MKKKIGNLFRSCNRKKNKISKGKYRNNSYRKKEKEKKDKGNNKKLMNFDYCLKSIHKVHKTKQSKKMKQQLVKRIV